MNRFALQAATVSMLCLALASTSLAQFTVLHTFSYNYAQNTSDGSAPFGEMALSGSTLYGATELGGLYWRSGNTGGTIFKVNTDGTSFASLHSFPSFSGDGYGPYAGVTLAGSAVFGTTHSGGSSGRGTIYKINTDGSGYAVVHSFTGGATDGGDPTSLLTSSGTTLYGTAPSGGAYSKGTLFKININGTGLSVLHAFGSISVDGAYPDSGMTLSGSTLYGTTSGSTTGYGTIFKINTDGTGFAVLHTFAGDADGASPSSEPVLSGSTLYGTTNSSNSTPTIFRINTDGTGYSIIHTFDSSTGPPRGDLQLSGSTLFGTTGGGTANSGTAFEINTDGTGYSVIHTFTSDHASIDGVFPSGMTLAGGALYGADTNGGDAYEGTGKIFSIGVPEPTTTALLGTALLIGGLFVRSARFVNRPKRRAN